MSEMHLASCPLESIRMTTVKNTSLPQMVQGIQMWICLCIWCKQIVPLHIYGSKHFRHGGQRSNHVNEQHPPVVCRNFLVKWYGRWNRLFFSFIWVQEATRIAVCFVADSFQIRKEISLLPLPPEKELKTVAAFAAPLSGKIVLG